MVVSNNFANFAPSLTVLLTKSFLPSVMINMKYAFMSLLASAFALSSMAQIPNVTTDTRYVRGSTMAFGRLTYNANGATVKETGFCYSENPEPTTDDSKHAKVLSNNGDIYWLKDLKPSTKYYMRAYLTTTNGITVYGKPVKFYTIPMGNVGFSFWAAGDTDEAIKTRCRNALDQACYYFNNMTSTTRYFDVAYSPGTPTADCNYQPTPHMNIGPVESYQRCGTVMHEMQHGLGLQNYSTQWNGSILRSGNGRGQWLGDRVTEALHFWDNNSTTVLNGDNIHMWPYGVNGAQEDNGTEELYLANAMICQALGEDGLQHNEQRFADPYYAINQEDSTKFYIKSESEEYGYLSSYLMVNKSGNLRWVEMTAAEAAENDSAAWYLTFTPENQYYQIQNAATGYYVTYASASSITTVKKSKLTEDENWHIMKGRVDVDGQRGYWVVHPAAGTWTPKCLAAASSKKTAVVDFDLRNSATAQRWLFMTAKEAKAHEQTIVSNLKSGATKFINKMKTLKGIPHAELTAGTDIAFEELYNELSTSVAADPITATQILTLRERALQGMLDFLGNVVATKATKPFDLTFLLTNPDFKEGNEGWSVAGTVSFNCMEFYENAFDLYQKLENMPVGTYQLTVQGFQRPGDINSAGETETTTDIYINDTKSKIANIVDGGLRTKAGKGNEVLAGEKYVPNNMEAASAYFGKSKYNKNTVESTLSSKGALKVGAMSTNMPSKYWTILNSFTLGFFGDKTAEPVGILQMRTPESPLSKHIYTLDGRRIATGTTLRPGIYLKNGKKTVVR